MNEREWQVSEGERQGNRSDEGISRKSEERRMEV